MWMWIWENLLVKYYPQIIGYFLVAFVVGWLVWKFASTTVPLKSLVDTIAKLATKEGLDAITKTIDNKIEPDLKDIRERFGRVEDRVETLWKDKFASAASPRQLNDRGNVVLSESGIKEIIDDKKSVLLAEIKKIAPKTAYDAEEVISKVVTSILISDPAIVNKLKDGAFRTGSDIDILLFVGSVYLRNLIFEELGFHLEDIDKK